MDKVKNLPNFITALRIIGTICLIFIEPFLKMFFLVYTIAGITDVLDGFVARITRTSSEFGAKLDSAADLLFYAVMILKILPNLLDFLPAGLWIFAAIIVGIRIASYILAGVKFHCFASLHTYLNKLTGFAVFLLPYFYLTPYLNEYGVVLCLIALASSLEEFLTHIIRAHCRSNTKTIFEKEKV